MAFISIIIPAYNEAGRIMPSLERILSYVKQKQDRFEIIVVDDGSTDATFEFLEKKYASQGLVTVIRNLTNKGKGYSVKRGALQAKGDYILFTDADLSTPITELEKLLRCANKGYDVVFGSRALKSKDVTIQKTFHRALMGRIFSFLTGVFVMKGIKDTQCGFKLFTSKAAKKIFPLQKLEGFSFDVELLYLAKKSGFSIKEVAVDWYDSKNSRVRLLRDSWRMFKDLCIIRSIHNNDR